MSILEKIIKASQPGEVTARLPYQRIGREGEHPMQTLIRMGYPYETWTKTFY